MIAVDVQKQLETPGGGMKLSLQFSLEKGDFLSLYGPSGAGKTSTLRMLAGLMTPEDGEIQFDGKLWYSKKENINARPQERSLGMVFQDYALFPNMTLRENLEFAGNKHKDAGTIAELIEIMELGDLQNRSPKTLSGGQQQRVALARALVQRPRLLLLDEPLSALDHKMRLRLQDYLYTLHNKFELTTILVSHEIGEILKLSNKILVLEDGKVKKSGSPYEVFTTHQIRSKFQFTGEVLAIEKADVIYILTLLIGNNVVKIIAQESEVRNLSIGDRVMVASKAFNPVIQKVGE
jgi:molybdate transport system ATP-binding protein